MPDKTEISMDMPFHGFTAYQMSDNEFALFSGLIYSRLGIKMPPVKKLMLASRLVKRLKALGFTSHKQYYDYICSDKGKSEEFNRMIDVVTTNKTDFFREPAHFDYLVNKVLSDACRHENFNPGINISIWSAGCSTGEEAYTLAMVLSDFFSGDNNKFSILATDVSPGVLQAGAKAVYEEDAIQPIPEPMRKKYLLRGKGEKEGLFRIIPQLRERVAFSRLNLMDDRFSVRADMDIIFCRNVIIYFDKKTQAALFKKFYNHLVPGGYMFIGSSESLYGINDDFYPVGPSIYRKPAV